MTVTIITGCPGSGKTTLARVIAASRSKGVHIPTDTFFGFVSNRIDPSLAAASDQNQAVVEAYCRASAAYAAGGYEVFLDGVIGPWMFPIIRPILADFAYVLLSIDFDSALERVTQRASQSSATAEVVARMHPQFKALESAYGRHLIVVADKTVAQVVAEYEKRTATGEFQFERT